MSKYQVKLNVCAVNFDKDFVIDLVSDLGYSKLESEELMGNRQELDQVMGTVALEILSNYFNLSYYWDSIADDE